MKTNPSGVDRADRAMTARLFQRTMITMVIAELTGALTALIDSVLTGRFLGETALAAFGLGGPYFSIASILSGVLTVGSTNLITKAIGCGDRKKLTGLFSLTMGLGLTLSVLFSVAGTVLAEQLASLFGAGAASREVFNDTADYLRGVFIGAPGFILFVVLTPLLQLDGDSTLPKIASLACALTDVGGDLLNVSVFNGGMFGMGLATSVSHYVALGVTLLHFARRKSMFRFSPGGIRLSDCPALLRDGVPRAVCMFCRALLPVLLNALALRIAGDMGVTALSTCFSSSFILGALGWGIGGAVLILGGMMAGEQNAGGLKTVAGAALRDILCGVTLLSVGVFFAAPGIAALFVPAEGELRDMAARGLRCYGACLPFLAFNVSASSYFQSLPRRGLSNLVNIGIEAAFPAAAAYALSALMGIDGVWLTFPVGQGALSLAILLVVFVRRDKERQGIEAHMLLRPGFGVPAEDTLERSPATIEEVVAMSEEVTRFCRERGFDGRTAYRLALCVEEMAGNVIEHGFCDGKPHLLAVRVLIKDGTVTLRMRDDCRLFDFKQQAAGWAFDPEHPEKNIGVRTVMAAARDVVYTGTMGTNNLIVTV